MSRRREEADLQKALHLSTQGSHHPSSVFLSSSSPIQIPSGFRLAFQSESTQGSVANPQFSDPIPNNTSNHNGTGSGSGSGSGASADPSTFQGFQGGIFAGLQTPLVGLEQDRSTSILSPTMMATERPGPGGLAQSRSNGGPRERRVLGDDVVAGSEDDETEEEEPFEALQRSAQKGRKLPLAAAKPMSPLPIPPSEPIESFPASSSSHHPKPSHPLRQPGAPAKYVSSPIEGFTTSNSNDRNSKGSSSTDPSRDAQRAQIVLSTPTEHARPRPQPRQRRRPDDGEIRLFDPDGANGSPMAGPSNTSNEASGSRSKPAEGSSGPARAASVEVTPPPPNDKPAIVYAKRSIHSKKRKIMLSDSEAEEQDPPITLDQAIAGPAVPAPDQPEKASGMSESKRKNQSEGEDRPSKKNRGRDDAAGVGTRDERETSIDPLDLGHVDPDRTPLKSRVVVEIDSAKRAGKEVQPDKDHDDDDDEVIIISSNLPKAKPKSKRRVQDDDDDEDPFEGLAPDAAMADTDEEDNFVPPGKKRKPPAKAKKAPAKKEKKPPKGKKGSTATPVSATAATVSTVDDTAELEAMPMQLDAPSTAATATAQTEVPKAVETASKKGTKPGKNGKGKDVPANKPASVPTQSTSAESKKKDKSAEFITSDEEDEAVPPPKKTAAKSTAGSEKAVAGVSGAKSKTKGRVAASDVEEEEVPTSNVEVEAAGTRSTVAESTESRTPAPVLQPTSVSQLNVVKDEVIKNKAPNFVVGKDGKIVEFRTTRDDLPKVVSNTGGVKRMGMSRGHRIPSLHRNLKAPPKRLAAPPKKPERKKKSDDEYSDEEPVDEFGRPKPKPGSKEWYMMED